MPDTDNLFLLHLAISYFTAFKTEVAHEMRAGDDALYRKVGNRSQGMMKKLQVGRSCPDLFDSDFDASVIAGMLLRSGQRKYMVMAISNGFLFAI